MTTHQADASRPIEARLPVPPGMAALAWGLLSLIGFVVSANALVWPIGPLEGLVGLPHVAVLGLGAIVSVLGGGLLALASARLVLTHGSASASLPGWSCWRERL